MLVTRAEPWSLPSTNTSTLVSGSVVPTSVVWLSLISPPPPVGSLIVGALGAFVSIVNARLTAFSCATPDGSIPVTYSVCGPSPSGSAV